MKEQQIFENLGSSSFDVYRCGYNTLFTEGWVAVEEEEQCALRRRKITAILLHAVSSYFS